MGARHSFPPVWMTVLAARPFTVEEFETEQLLGLLELYETAVGELAKLGDPGLGELIARYRQREAEVIAALAARNSEAISAVRGFTSPM